jgi:hypothetical protein
MEGYGKKNERTEKGECKERVKRMRRDKEE